MGSQSSRFGCTCRLSSYISLEEITLKQALDWPDESPNHPKPRVAGISPPAALTGCLWVEEEWWWGNEQSGPFETVECTKLFIIGGLRSNCEVGVNSCKDFEQALHDGEEVCGNTANDLELLISPPLFNAHSTPPQFQNPHGENGDEECNEEEACKCANLQQGNILEIEH
ncbi:hypothetical protein IEQ34_007494 [Dendrobium chrysotoxum]|uniref:Uncharacterized protein n=1 Tax=Dendrobium chrysotoxum TaxID=161865 RepID=A0AAV7H200_DENCH|nr:hypothetical protein IEQ34_007494 [Dendrobium chrysotoxum]